MSSLTLPVAVSWTGRAVRTALARGIIKWHNDPQMKDIYLAYDRTLLVNDSRQKEAKKPHGSGARAKFQKSYR